MSERIAEFNDIVDQLIQRQIDGAGLVSWPGMGRQVEAAGLLFSKVEKHHSRDGRVGFNPGDLVMRAATGAVTARVEDEDRLITVKASLSFRTHGDERMDSLLQINNGRTFFGFVLSAEITDPDEQADVIRYVRSPHLELDAVRRATTLDSEESQRYLTKAAEDRASDEAFREELRDMDRQLYEW